MSSNKLVIPNIIIFSIKNNLEKFFLNNNLDENITIDINDIRYNNNDLDLYCLKHFDKNI